MVGNRTIWFLIVSPVLATASILTITYLATTYSYYSRLRLFSNKKKPGKQILRAPQIPYSIPWLGNAREFLTPYPGRYWERLLSWHPRSSGVCTLLVAGKRSHILFSTAAVQALFKTKSASRDVFDREILPKIFGFTIEETERALAGKPVEHEITARYLLNNEAVNELTSNFTRILDEILARDLQQVDLFGDIDLYEFVRNRIFEASVRALLGERILPMYPDFCNDFFFFDREFLKFYFGTPKMFARELYANRERLLAKLTEWSRDVHREIEQPADPVSSPAWEPYLGSRLNRARQRYYRDIGLSARSAAGLDLGIVFALNSNIIPSVGWMLMHLLSPSGDATLLPRLLQELRQAQRADGGLDIPKLTSGPLLQSLWTETLRLYTDVLVARNLLEDIVLPLDDEGETFVAMRKGDNIYAPCWLGHRDPGQWAGEVPFDIWQAERFLVKKSSAEEGHFSAIGTAGKYFPFGGGKTICPGRTFAKQEGLGALAMILLRFDFEVIGRVDGDGKPTSEFPAFTKVPSGSGAIAPSGDFKVRIRARTDEA